MAEYAENILKTDAYYYRLSRASIKDGILKLSAGGWAETEITSLQLTNLTEYFRVSYIADKYCDPYGSDIRIYVWAKDTKGNYYNYTFFPCDTHNNLYLQEFQVKAIAYEKLIWRIETDVPVTISLWELCPEAEDINVQTLIDGVNQSLPRLLFDYNTWPLTVGEGESTVGLITFRLLDKTDLQGHFIMSFYASEAAILTIRFYTNEIEELFAPLTYDVRKGYNSIGIPHCYLHRSAGLYSVMATAQISAGSINIPTRGVLYSIDGGYLAKRELDLAMDARDLSIRQLSSSVDPDEVWLIGIDAGEVLVRKRDYSETNPNVAFTPVVSLGQGVDAAIEFNGIWALRPAEDRYTIETEEEPWYFWIDNFHVLWGQLGNDETTRIQLADHVIGSLHACRGYVSNIYPEQDQGLVIVYLKNDNKPYYRTYSYNVASGKVIWELEQLLYDSTEFAQVNVHRVNDYRLSFELSGNQRTLWLLTDRTYVGQSASPETVYVSGLYLEDTQYPNFIGYYTVPQSEYPQIALRDFRVDGYYDEGMEKMMYYYYFTLDHICFGTQQVVSWYDRIKINNGQIRLWDVKYETDELSESTFITILAEDYLGASRFTLTLINDPTMRILHNGLIYAHDYQEDIIIDNAIHTYPKDRITLQENLVVAAQMYSTNFRTIYPKDNCPITDTITASVIMSSVVRRQLEVTDTENMATSLTCVIGYYKSGEEPV